MNIDNYIENLMPYIKSELVNKQKREWSPIAKKILNTSNVSDKIDISTWTIKDWKVFHEMYGNDDYYKDPFGVPADLFFSHTLPIKDVFIIEDSQEFRVSIRDDYVSQVENMKNSPKEPVIIGAMDYHTQDGTMRWSGLFALVLLYGQDKIMLQYCGKDSADENLEREVSKGPLLDWYMMQLNLLNPVTKDLFSRPVVLHISVKNKNGNNCRKRKVQYIKVHKIKSQEIEQKFYDEHKKINRKCLCWYVIGHWREYKNGNKVFIQGYWKGALRETKKNYDECRERVIDAEVIE